MKPPAADRSRNLLGSTGPGLYVHVPFCKVRCGYCDFYTLATSVEGQMKRTAEALVAEAALRAPEWNGGAFDNVFVGGGTPTHLGAPLLKSLLIGLRDGLPIEVGAEWTIEANPESASNEVLETALRCGVNRISIGVQSFDEAQLTLLDRLHDAAGAVGAFVRARSLGFASVSIDLIYGLPAAEPGTWERTLTRAIDLGPDHISCYCLALEPRVPMARRGVKLAGDARARNEYDLARRLLGGAGYAQYEISNWSRPGMECRHNVNVWRGGDYLGLGPGAHGHARGVRRANRPDLAGYLGAIESRLDAPHDTQTIEGIDRAEERLMLGLRLREGIDWVTLESGFGSIGAARIRERASAVLAAGLLEDDGARLRIADRGLFVSNALTAELLGDV